MQSLYSILPALEAGSYEVQGRTDRGVHAIRYDSREVRPGDLFVAVNGRHDRGVEFTGAAIAAGARVVVTDAPDRMPYEAIGRDDVTLIVLQDARLAMARLAHAMAGYPARRLKLFGVTGTNGKTTGAYVLRQFLEACGERTGMIGTLGTMIDSIVPTGYTTPEAPELAAILADMVDAGVSTVVMEVSSHALALHRVAGLDFAGAFYTNLTQDHLDFHTSMDEYRDTKKRLFEMLAPGCPAAINLDDPYGAFMGSGVAAEAIGYGSAEGAHARIGDVTLAASGSRWTLSLADRLGGGQATLSTPLVGAFNVWNVTGALTLALGAGYDRTLALNAVAGLRAVPGRMQSIALASGAVAVVDYAHTPDALENVLLSLRELRVPPGRITVVFGCGGDRDRMKRPMMGAIASRLADRVILTSDNPRGEDPEAIIDAIEAGIGPGTDAERIVDRRAAIELALEGAANGDIVLVAGKGHEDYQIVGAERRHFDDAEVVRGWAARHVEGAA